MSPDLYIALQFLLGFGVPMAIALREIIITKPSREPPFNGGEPTVIDLATHRKAPPAQGTAAVAEDEREFRRAA